MNIEPVGYFKTCAKYPYDVPHQFDGSAPQNYGVIELLPRCNFEQTLDSLDGFSHLWILFVFHKNTQWHAKVLPPRGGVKRGVFATRSPHRPNFIGMTAVCLLRIDGLKLYIAGHDLIDGTPVLDIKPYLAVDRIDSIRQGWIDALDPRHVFKLYFSERLREQLSFLEKRPDGAPCLEAFLREQLAFDPLNDTRKRLKQLDECAYWIAYRTWRIYFTINPQTQRLFLHFMRSGYTADELLADAPDPYADKACHRDFITLWG